MEKLNLTFNVEEINRFLELTKQKGAQLLSDLGKLVPFIEAVYNSEVGKEILKDDLQKYEELLKKVQNLEATEEEKAEYRYLRNTRLPRVVGRIHAFLKRVEAIKEIASK